MVEMLSVKTGKEKVGLIQEAHIPNLRTPNSFTIGFFLPDSENSVRVFKLPLPCPGFFCTIRSLAGYLE